MIFMQTLQTCAVNRRTVREHGRMPKSPNSPNSKGVSYPQIVSYLESIGAKKKEIDRTLQTKEALQQLASKHGGDLKDTDAVLKADTEKKQALENNKIAAREKKMRPLSEDALRRYRLAFDHFDEDDSGELDPREFQKAMIDSGMMPLGFEVSEMFHEADTDGGGTVCFDEYCRFVQVRTPSLCTPTRPAPPRVPRALADCPSAAWQLYKSNQNCCEAIMEKIMDMMSPQPSYMLVEKKAEKSSPTAEMV